MNDNPLTLKYYHEYQDALESLLTYLYYDNNDNVSELEKYHEREFVKYTPLTAFDNIFR